MPESEFTEADEAALERDIEEWEKEKEVESTTPKDEEKQKTLEGDVADQALLKQTDEEKAERYQDILVGLGFKPYDNKEKGWAYKLRTHKLNIGRTFTEQNPKGKFWAKLLEDAEFGKKGDFLPGDELKAIPEIALFYRIRDDELQIPELEVTGKIIAKTEKAVQIQFTELNQIRSEWWGLGAVKRNKEGIHFIAAGFSRPTEKYPQEKMTIPRDIILADYEEQLKNAPTNGHPQSQESDEDYTPEDVELKQHEKEEAEQKEVEETAGKQIIDDMAYFIVKTKDRLIPLFGTDKMTQAEVNELIRTLAISAGIEYGYRIRDRNRRY